MARSVKKKTATRKAKRQWSPDESIGKRNEDGSINMCRVDDRGLISIIPVHVIRGKNIGYGPGYKDRREVIKYDLDTLFLSKEEALAKSEGIYRAYEADPYREEVRTVYLKLYRGSVVRAAHPYSYGRDNLNDLHTTEAAALEKVITHIREENDERRQTLKKDEATLKKFQTRLAQVKKRKTPDAGHKFSDVRKWVYDAEETRKAKAAPKEAPEQLELPTAESVRKKRAKKAS